MYAVKARSQVVAEEGEERRRGRSFDEHCQRKRGVQADGGNGGIGCGGGQTRLRSAAGNCAGRLEIGEGNVALSRLARQRRSRRLRARFYLVIEATERLSHEALLSKATNARLVDARGRCSHSTHIFLEATQD